MSGNIDLLNCKYKRLEKFTLSKIGFTYKPIETSLVGEYDTNPKGFDFASSVLSNVCDEIREKHEDYICKCFEKYGYDKQWMIENRHRVMVYHCEGNIVDVFYLEGKPLFEVHKVFIEKHNEENNKYEIEVCFNLVDRSKND